MKKIFCIILLALTGCRMNNPEVPVEEIQPLTKQEILLDYTRKVEKESPIELTQENIGINFTPITMMGFDSTILKKFKNCNDNETGVDISIYTISGQIRKQYILYLSCDDKVSIYYYDSIEPGSEPVAITEKDNK